MGRSDHHASRPRQYHLVIGNGTKYKGICRLGWVSDLQNKSWATELKQENSRTKKKDIYVISTLQRPVPLEHYLYAGREMHKILDASRVFISNG